jgi:hypothetical protein
VDELLDGPARLAAALDALIRERLDEVWLILAGLEAKDAERLMGHGRRGSAAAAPRQEAG